MSGHLLAAGPGPELVPGALGHDTTAVTGAVDGAGHPPSVELGRATALFTRVLEYVERATYPATGRPRRSRTAAGSAGRRDGR